MKAPNALLKIADGMLALERGHDELLLANHIVPRPLYVKEGRRYILEFLKVAAGLESYEQIIAAYPHERNLLDVLLDYGILVPDQAESPRNKVWPSMAKSVPARRVRMSLYLLMSQSCNMSCVYCLNGKSTYQRDKDLKMSREVAFKSIDRCLNDLSDEGRLEVVFFGGEPLLNWPLAQEVVTHCEECLRERHKGKHVHYHVTSNLTFIPNDLIEWAKKYQISILCDIDGPPAIHNRCRPFRNGSATHESTVRNIGKIRSAGLQIDLRATITSLNQDCLPEIAEHHKALGGNSSGFVPVAPVNSDMSILPEELLPSPAKVIEGMTDVFRSMVWKTDRLFPFNHYASRIGPGSATTVGCGAAHGNLPVVDANGRVYPCIYLVGNGKFQMGNIMDDSYPNGTLLEQLHGKLHVDHNEECKACSWRYLCGGGCPLGPLTVDDNPMATARTRSYCRKIRCDYTRRILELLLWQKADEAASNRNEEPVQIPICG